MKNIWILTITNIKRNLLGITISVLGAAILCLCLYLMGEVVVNFSEAKVSIGIIDYDQSILSQDFKRYLTEQLDYELVDNYDYNRLSTELIDKNISVIIEIPENFYEQYATGGQEKVIITSLEDYENAAFIRVYINSYLSSIRALAAGAMGDTDAFDHLLKEYPKQKITMTQSAAVEVDQRALTGKSGFINSVGFYLMFTFVIGIIICFMVLDDRLKGLFSRIQATPVKPIQYILGSGIFGMVLCFIQIVIYCSYIYFRNIPIGIPISILALMMGLYSLFTVSFSLAIALALKSKNAITAVVIGFSSIGCVMGGAYFSLDSVPKTLQNLARVFPQYWFMDALRKLQEKLTVNIFPDIAILTLFTTLCLLIGAVLFSQNYKNS